MWHPFHAATLSVNSNDRCAVSPLFRPTVRAHKAASKSGGDPLQILIDLLAGLMAMLAALTLSQFGVNLDPRGPAAPEHEVHRLANCDDGDAATPALTLTITPDARDC